MIVYLLYIISLWAVALAAHAARRKRASDSPVGEFYTLIRARGSKTAMVDRHCWAFLFLQLLYLFFYTWIALQYYIMVTFAVFCAYVMVRERKRRPKEEGIEIGRQFAHPSHFKDSMPSDKRSQEREVVRSGKDRQYVMDLKSEPNPHVIAIGESGSGKSTTITALLVRNFVHGNVPFLIIDWSGTYRELGAKANLWEVPKSIRINPLQLRGMDSGRRAGIASEMLQNALGMTNLQTQAVRGMLKRFYDEGVDPTVEQLIERIEVERGRDKKMHLSYLANRLKLSIHVFGQEPKTFWESYAKTCNVVELEGLTDMEKNLVTQALLQRIIEEFKSDSRVRLYISLDDAYQALGDEYSRESLIAKIVREGRKYGFGLVTSTQLLQDMPDSVIANSSIKIIHGIHEPQSVDRVSKMLSLGAIERDILYSMPTGSAFVYDQLRSQNENFKIAYVQIDRLSDAEIGEFGTKVGKIDIGEIEEAKPRGSKSIFDELELPSVAIYRFILALRDAGDISKAHKLLKERGWITSDTTIYGNRSKPSLLARAKAFGYVDEYGKLTSKAQEIIESKRIIGKQGIYKGSEEHITLMKETISSIQNRGNLAFTLNAKDSFDIGEFSPEDGAKNIWDLKGLRIYEIQNNILKEEIAKGVEKARKYHGKLIFVVAGEALAKKLKEITNEEVIFHKPTSHVPP
ncbi:MAG: ATP-binding protein [Candidatus Micrarchaeota archaeon]|nr:ATP-binding protein [Candidatus Micrarchaeota archaeon]